MSVNNDATLHIVSSVNHKHVYNEDKSELRDPTGDLTGDQRVSTQTSADLNLINWGDARAEEILFG